MKEEMKLKVLQRRPPGTLEELEAQLVQSLERLDRGEGVDGKESLRRIRKRMKEARLKG